MGTFLEFLTEVKGIDDTSHGPGGRIFRALSISGGGSCREASLRLAGLGSTTDLFEELWAQYEKWTKQNNDNVIQDGADGTIHE